MSRSAAAAPASVRDHVVLAVGAAAALVLGACFSPTAPDTRGVVLWVGNGGNTILGFTAAQLVSSTRAVPAVVLPTSNIISDIAFDAHGNLWVAEEFANSVVEYAKGQQVVTPSVTLAADANGSLNGPISLVFDASGNLWVGNGGGSDGPGPNTLVRFNAGQLATSGSPTPEVTLSAIAGSIDYPCGLAFDRAGNLWMTSDPQNAVAAFSPGQLASSGSPAPAVTISTAGNVYFGGAVSLAFDAGGNLWVANAVSNTVVEFAANQLGSTRSLTPAVTLTGIINPQALAFDEHGDLWVASYSAMRVLEFAANQLTASAAPTPAVAISGASISGPAALAFTR